MLLPQGKFDYDASRAEQLRITKKKKVEEKAGLEATGKQDTGR